MPKLSIENVGLTTVVIKDLEGYTSWKADVASGVTGTYNVSQDLIDRIAPTLALLEGEPRQTNNTVLTGIRWSILASADQDDRALSEGLSGLPQLLYSSVTGYDAESGNADITLTGTGLLGTKQVKSSVNISNLTVATATLVLTAVKPGSTGNDISCQVAVDTGVAPLTITVPSTNTIVVTLAAAGNTCLAIATAINVHAAAKLLVQATVGLGDAIAFTAAVAKTYLYGGKGPGMSLTLSGTACTISATSATSITCSLPADVLLGETVVYLNLVVGPHSSILPIPARLSAANTPRLLKCSEDYYSPSTGAANITLTGTGMLGDQTKAGKTISNTTPATATVIFEAVRPGTDGNAITVTVATGGGLAISVLANAITITLGSAGSTSAAIAAAINLHAAALLLVQATAGVAGTFTLAVAATALTGGLGDNVSLTLGGTACTISAMSATSITCTLPTGIGVNRDALVLELGVGRYYSSMALLAMLPPANAPKLLTCNEDNYSNGGGKLGVTLTGTGLLGEQVQAKLSVLNTLGTAQIDLVAIKPGTVGNSTTIEIVTGGGLVVSVIGTAILVTLGGAGSTCTAIVAAINAHAAALLLVEATVFAGGGVSFVDAAGPTPLAGGLGSGVALALGGTACPISEYSATSITCDFDAGISVTGATVALELDVGRYSSRTTLIVVV